jgi:hypothetical protein
MKKDIEQAIIQGHILMITHMYIPKDKLIGRDGKVEESKEDMTGGKVNNLNTDQRRIKP